MGIQQNHIRSARQVKIQCMQHVYTIQFTVAILFYNNHSIFDISFRGIFEILY